MHTFWGGCVLFCFFFSKPILVYFATLVGCFVFFSFLNHGRMFLASGCVVKRDRQRETYSQNSWLKYKWISRELMHGMRKWKAKQSRQAFIFIACLVLYFCPLSLCFVEATRWRVAVMIAWMNPRPHSASSRIRLVSAVIQNVPPFFSSICIGQAGRRVYDECCCKQRRCWLTACTAATNLKCS